MQICYFLRARELPTTKGEKMLKRGFISRSASVVTLVGALALLSSISGVTAGTIDDSVGNAQQSPSSLVFSSASADGFSYSRWLENQGTVPASADSASTDESQADQGQAPITYGSFVLTETPLERIYGNVKDSWTQTFENIITRAGDTSMLRGWAMDYVTGQEVDIQAGIDSWWNQRQADTTGIFVGMADVLTDNIFQAGEDQVGGLSFIRSLDWDYQTELGDRPWQLGVNAIGSLREADDDVILWQLRGFTAKDSKGGANAGLIYRWAQEDTAMFGVNTFLDFEAHDRGDFLRWSVGGEVRTEWIDLYGNRYLAITDPRLQSDGTFAYSKDGLDLEAAFHIPDMRWVSGYIKYYLWEGQGTDPETGENNSDDKGFVYGVRVSPPMAENLRLELELDDQDGGDLDIGGRVSYRHEFGGIPAGTRTAGASSSFDPRDYFFDAVRREYAQRIGIYGAAGPVATVNKRAPSARMILSSFAETVTVDINNSGESFSREDSITITVSETGIDPDGNAVAKIGKDIVGISESGYDISLSDQTQISFEEQGDLVKLFMGNLYINRDADEIKKITTPNMTIRLIGTDLRVVYDLTVTIGTAIGTEINLDEGEISLAYAPDASFIASVAGNAQIHDDYSVNGSVTYYACNGAVKEEGSNFIGVTAIADCALNSGISHPADKKLIVAVNLPKKDVVTFDVSKGIGAYDLVITDPSGYFEVVRDEDDSSIFYISVTSVPEEEDGNKYVITWDLDDEGELTEARAGTITVEFTKAPSAGPVVRYAVDGARYKDSITVEVVGGVPDETTGYTFTLVDGYPSGYDLKFTTGFTIVLDADVNSIVSSHYVTIIMKDSQNPPQSGIFLLDVRLISVLTFEPDSATSAIEGRAEVIDLTPYAKGGNIGNAAAESDLSFKVSPAMTGFNVGTDNMLTVAADAPTGVHNVPIIVSETNPMHEGSGVIVITVTGSLSASGITEAVVPVNLTTEVGKITPTGGIGDYTFVLTDDVKGYFTINSSLGLINVNNAPESEDGNSYILSWTLNDGDSRSPVVTGEVSVKFTKAPSAENALRYAVVNQAYSENITIAVVGGVPDSTNGYTFALTPATGYGIASNSGKTIVLNASHTYTEAGVSFVTVSITDGQDNPQSGTFVLEVRVVPVLAFSDAALTILQTESSSLLSFVSGGNTMYAEDNTRTFEVISDSEGFTADNDGVLNVGGAAELLGLNTVTVQVVDTNPSQSAAAALVISVQYKATPVAFDSDNINLPLEGNIDPDVDVPLSITLKATGGAEAPSYTFSITEGDETWLTIVSPNVLVVEDGAPGSGTHTFKVEVVDSASTDTDNTAELEISFNFMRPQAMVSEIVGEIIITGGDGAGTYSAGDLPKFDPKTSGGITLDVQEDGNSAKVELENGDIVVDVEFVSAGSLNPATGEWIFFSAREIAILVSTGGATFKSDGIAFGDATGNELAEAYNTPGMVAIMIGGDVSGQITSSVRYVLCEYVQFTGTPGAWGCTVQDPTSSSTNTATRSLAATNPSTGADWPRTDGRFYAHFPVVLPRYETPDADCEVPAELVNCANKLAIIIGDRDAFLPIELTERDDVQFFPYGGEWIFFDGSPINAEGQVRLRAGFNLDYDTNCTVTLPESSVCTDESSSSSTSFASVGS